MKGQGACKGTAAPLGALEIAGVPPPLKTRRILQQPRSPTGGLATVIYTDALQTIIMVVGTIILAVKGEGWGL
jgi:hypothetical protein